MTVTVLALWLSVVAVQDARRGVDWPSFRGPNASGLAEGFATVAEWDVASGKNVLWRVEVPGLAHSSPVIHGDRLFLTTAVRKEGDPELTVGLYGSITPVRDEGEQLFRVLCLDKKTGQELWSHTAFDGEPRYPRHPKGSYAASSPATDGQRVVAFFGTEGLYAYDMDGEPLWQRHFGDLDSCFYMMPSDSQWGFAASPVLVDGKVVIQADVLEGSFVAVLDAATGKDLWRTARDEVPTFSTPTVAPRGDGRQVVCNGYKHIGGYDLATGKELWSLAGGGDVPVPAPVVAGDQVFITNAHGRMAPIVAIDLAAEGALELDPEKSDAVRWLKAREGAYMQTPLAVGEFLYVCRDNGVLGCFALEGGEQVYEERLGSGQSGYTSSGVYADGKLYYASEEGVVHVVPEGIDFEVVARNDLGEECMATPAISEGVLYYRTRRHLAAIGKRP